MIRAAAFCYGIGAVVVADDATSPPTLISRMDVTPETEPAAVARALASAGVARLAIALPEWSHPAFAFLSAVLASAAPMSMEGGIVPAEAWRAKRGAARRVLPPGKGSESERQAVAVLLASIDTPLAELLERSAAAVEGSPVELAIVATPAKPPPAPLPPPSGAVRMGIDPGAVNLGIVVGRGDVAPLHVVEHVTLPVGAEVPYSRPVKRKRKDGREVVSTHHRVLAMGDAGKLADKVLDIARKHGVTEATIERVTYVWGADAARATGVLRAAAVCEVICDRLMHAGIAVVPSLVSTARAQVIGKANKGDTDVTKAIREGFVNPELLSTVDERDAGLLCLLAAKPPPAPAIPREPRKPRDPNAPPRKRDRDESHRRRYQEPARTAERTAKQARIAAERAAAGCTCRVGGRHKATCPLAPAPKTSDATA